MHVAFDMDGVLLDSTADLSWLDRALDRALQAFDLEPTPEHRRRLYPTNLRNFESAAADLGLPAEPLWERRHEEYVTEKTAAIENGTIGPFEDLAELRPIAEAVPISIVSNSPQSVVDTFVETAGLEPIVDQRIGRGDTLAAIEEMKPARAFYDRLDAAVGADRYVYVGDGQTDALFAQRTGMAFVHLDREEGEVRSLEAARRRIVARP